MGATAAQASWTFELDAILRCPACGSSISSGSAGLACSACETSFPGFATQSAVIPWLFHDPITTLLEWKARLNGFLHANQLEQARLQGALAHPTLSNAHRRRILASLRARKGHAEQVLELLAPLGFDGVDFDSSHTPTHVLRSSIPPNQGLSSYCSNVFRDWAWENGENEQLLEALSEVAGFESRRLGKMLTLGAGACRLPYDIHRHYAPDLSVTLDINPLLMLLASRVVAGAEVPLYEFPIAPLDNDSFAALQKCRAPEALDDNFHFVLADALRPPFAPATFDTVLTPWLIDIVSQDLHAVAAQINRLLRKGGIWLNTGSLAFFHADEGWRYSDSEVQAVLKASGFEIYQTARRNVSYLRSPLSAHGRIENVYSFSARKVREVPAPEPHHCVPQWIRATDQKIPELPEFLIASSNHLLKTQVLAAIDGKRSIDEIGDRIAQQYGLDPREATLAVARIVLEEYENGIEAPAWH